MLNRIFFAIFFLSLYSSGFSLRCRWIDGGKLRENTIKLRDLLDTMANSSTNATEDVGVENTMDNLHSQASNASATDKLAFTVQILREVADLFEEDHSDASWEDSTVDEFLLILNRQADELNSCIGSHMKKNKKLHMYFKRLSAHILKKMGHSAAAWELVRTKIKVHLMRAHVLLAN